MQNMIGYLQWGVQNCWGWPSMSSWRTSFTTCHFFSLAQALFLWGKTSRQPRNLPQTNWCGAVQSKPEAHCDLVRKLRQRILSHILIVQVRRWYKRVPVASIPTHSSANQRGVNLLRYLARFVSHTSLLLLLYTYLLQTLPDSFIVWGSWSRWTSR